MHIGENLTRTKIKNKTQFVFFNFALRLLLLKTVLPCKALAFSYGLITAVITSFTQFTDLFLQDPWILRLGFRDDCHLCGQALSHHLPSGTPGQHQENQVGGDVGVQQQEYLYIIALTAFSVIYVIIVHLLCVT